MTFFLCNLKMSIIHNPCTNLAYIWVIPALSCVLPCSWHIREGLWDLGPAAACWQCHAPLRDAISLSRALGMPGNRNFPPKARSQVGVLPHLMTLSFCERGYFSNALPT